MQRSFEKLYKIFKLEAEFGYSNKAVVGGLEKLTDSWIGEARAEGVPEDQIQKVGSLLNQYRNLNISERTEAIKEIGHNLDIAGLKYLSDAEMERASEKQNQSPQPLPENNDEKVSQNQKKSRGSRTKQNNVPA
ncbi:MAG: hypothetical protein ACK2TV_12025, partial [Anaerolineales bacterium]